VDNWIASSFNFQAEVDVGKDILQIIFLQIYMFFGMHDSCETPFAYLSYVSFGAKLVRADLNLTFILLERWLIRAMLRRTIVGIDETYLSYAYKYRSNMVPISID
jgi:hypothetical protein